MSDRCMTGPPHGSLVFPFFFLLLCCKRPDGRATITSKLISRHARRGSLKVPLRSLSVPLSLSVCPPPPPPGLLPHALVCVSLSPLLTLFHLSSLGPLSPGYRTVTQSIKPQTRHSRRSHARHHPYSRRTTFLLPLSLYLSLLARDSSVGWGHRPRKTKADSQLMHEESIIRSRGHVN
ncbi:hypothetical protein CDEST_12326 [Colletotrichum destructivum]|uniref:Secreted protein n=1 Tax=Colletotrichum destructivum TaxID=34406 RepID=A0AAX4IVR1_9PEZI|nr:hypothetical protein CDEST_12326 [Colletotrichum destructivum]